MIIMPTFESSELIALLTECMKKLEILEDCYQLQEKFTSEFRSFLQHLKTCFSKLSSNAIQIFSDQYKNKILLCLSQISKSLRLFGILFHEQLYRQGVWYVCERLRWCVSELRHVFCSAETAAGLDNESGSFSCHIDIALQLLETHGVNVPASWNQLINDIVCQAVTIAKIATSLDYKEITSASQRLLKDNSQLMNEEVADSNQTSFLKESLSSSLITLEQRVNVAILRLVIQVFSEPNKPVKQLVRLCGQSNLPRSLGDLDSAVEELDAYIEKVTLIGHFAVTCCEDNQRNRDMRCCLASVESVDNYLVPVLKALYLTPSCGDKRMFARLLCDHWQDEVATLHSHLDNIIDSAAFAKVVQESICDLSTRLCKKETSDEIGKSIIKQGWLFYRHLSSTTASSVDLSHLKQSIYECEAAITKHAPVAAVVKRVHLVMSAIDKVADQLINPQVDPQQPLTVTDSYQMVKSIRDIPLEISFSSFSKSQHASYRPQWLQKKICEVKRGLLGELTDSSNKLEVTCSYSMSNPTTAKVIPAINVCETPTSTVKKEVDFLTPFLNKTTTERNTTLYVRTPREVVLTHMVDTSSATDCCWCSTNGSSSLALDITDILDNLSMFADTLSSDKEAEAIHPQPTPPADLMKRYFSGGSLDSQMFSLASVRTEEVSADVNTPERVEDLKFLDEKIRNLKLQ